MQISDPGPRIARRCGATTLRGKGPEGRETKRRTGASRAAPVAGACGGPSADLPDVVHRPGVRPERDQRLPHRRHHIGLETVVPEGIPNGNRFRHLVGTYLDLVLPPDETGLRRIKNPVLTGDLEPFGSKRPGLRVSHKAVRLVPCITGRQIIKTQNQFVFTAFHRLVGRRRGRQPLDAIIVGQSEESQAHADLAFPFGMDADRVARSVVAAMPERGI